jgi:hypothetical protein
MDNYLDDEPDCRSPYEAAAIETAERWSTSGRSCGQIPDPDYILKKLFEVDGLAAGRRG